MPRRTILRLTRTCSLPALLDKLVAHTNRHQGPHRTPVTTLKPVAAATEELPVFINLCSGRVGLIYREEPSPARPLGEPLLWILLRPVHREGAERGGTFRGKVNVQVWQAPHYPLSPKEVEWFIADFCGCADHKWHVLPDSWQMLYLACTAGDSPDDSAGDACHPAATDGEPGAQGPSGAAPAAPSPGQAPGAQPRPQPAGNPSRGGSRQPRTAAARLPSSVWLEQEIAKLDDLYAFQHLFAPWLALYQREEGHLPCRPKASFEEAAEACVERILHKRAGRRR